MTFLWCLILLPIAILVAMLWAFLTAHPVLFCLTVVPITIMALVTLVKWILGK